MKWKQELKPMVERVLSECSIPPEHKRFILRLERSVNSVKNRMRRMSWETMCLGPYTDYAQNLFGKVEHMSPELDEELRASYITYCEAAGLDPQSDFYDWVA